MLKPLAFLIFNYYFWALKFKIISMKKIFGIILTALATIAICCAFCQGGPTAQCKDGTYSYSKTHQGTCSHHGGVAVWYK